MKITITEESISKLAEKSIVSDVQAKEIWNSLKENNSNTPSFNITHFFYYFGGIICILAMTWLMTQGWEQFGGMGLSLISLIYMIGFTVAAKELAKDNRFIIPSGLLYTIAVCMTPLLVYGLQRWLEFWEPNTNPGIYRDYHLWIKGQWVLMSLATIAVGGVYLSRIKFTFLTMPIAVALYYLSMDLVPLIHGVQGFESYELRKIYSLYFGLGMLIFSFALDRKEKEDYSFWLYLFGLMAFWGGLTSMHSDSEVGKFLYFLINLILIGFSLYLHRRVFMIFGLMGSMFYLWHLSDEVFKDSFLFPIVMTFIGLAVMYIGIHYQKNEKKISDAFTAKLPNFLLRYRPKERN